MVGSASPHCILDDFLSATDSARLFADILAAETSFVPSQVGAAKNTQIDRAIRSSLRLPGHVRVDLAPLRAAVMEQSSALCAAAGVAPFPVHHLEWSIVVHGDGDYYRPHIDTRTGEGGSSEGHFRVLSCVYYLHRLPRVFSGGALAFRPLGPLGGASVEPAHNRLVAFPAFIPHEVLPIVCPGNAFAERRFSVNCWLHRARADQGSGIG
jgi:SM-20-related protein